MLKPNTNTALCEPHNWFLYVLVNCDDNDINNYDINNNNDNNHKSDDNSNNNHNNNNNIVVITKIKIVTSI
jgi:hypothetical protein